MNNTKEVAPQINETAVSAEVDSGLTKDLAAERAQALAEIGSRALPEMVITADGSIITKEEALAQAQSGNSSGPYDGKGMR